MSVQLFFKRLLPWSPGLFLVIALSACGLMPRSMAFALIPNRGYDVEETLTVEIDNCNSEASGTEIFNVPRSGRAFNAENLRPNGGEPFQSLRQHVIEVYGESAETVSLTAPPGAIREFDLVVVKAIYTGKVEGAIIAANKILRGVPVTYFYPVVKDVTIAEYRDQECEAAE